jgi:hypothetical protein
MNWKTLIGNIEEKTGNNCDYKVAVPASWKRESVRFRGSHSKADENTSCQDKWPPSSPSCCTPITVQANQRLNLQVEGEKFLDKYLSN